MTNSPRPQHCHAHFLTYFTIFFWDLAVARPGTVAVITKVILQKSFQEYVRGTPWALVFHGMLRITATTGYTGNSLARGCHRILTGLRQMMSQPTPTGRRLIVNERHRHCLRPSSARPTDGFLCQRSCLSILSRGTWTQFKYYLITSLRPGRLVAETWGNGWSSANGQFLARTCQGSHYACILCEGCSSGLEMRLGNTTGDVREKFKISDVAVHAFAMFITSVALELDY